jgi:hypothetical protein
LRADFAPKLPARWRAPFRALVGQVHGPRRRALSTFEFYEKYA